MFTKFLSDLVDRESFRRNLSEEAKNEFAEKEDVYFVHSPVMYRLYTMYASTEKIKERRRFFRLMGAYLYYDKFPCRHGDEFYYYVKFNKDSAFYQEHKALIDILILSADPENLEDYIGNRDLTIYNQILKSKKETH